MCGNIDGYLQYSHGYDMNNLKDIKVAVAYAVLKPGEKQHIKEI